MTATIAPKFVYGQRTDVRKNAHYLSDEDIVYPVGAAIIFQNFTTNIQISHLLPSNSIDLQILLLSPQRQYIATLVNDPQESLVHIFDSVKFKRKRTLSLPKDLATKKIVWMSFSFDDKFVVVLTGDPDWMMLVYNWERGKVETSTKANYSSNPRQPVKEVVCSPFDSNTLVIFGEGIFRLMNLQESVWRQYGWQKAENLHITSCIFLTGDRILCGTHDGLLLFIDLGELKFIFEADVVNYINARADKEEELVGTVTSATALTRVEDPDQKEPKQDRAIRAMILLNNGFAYACRPALVHFFEKITPHKYKKRNIYEITDKDFRENQSDTIALVKHLAVNAEETKMLATTERCQLYEVKLWGPELDIAGKVPFKHVGYSLHSGQIGDLSVCLWKPIFMTSGTFDRTVRVWNYITNNLEMMKQYQEDVYSVSLHPSGLYSAIGFSDKLRFMVVLIDDLLVNREFPIRECPKSMFSTSGTLLAAVNRNLIQVYSTITFQNTINLRGHSGLIKHLNWSADDRILVSCGSDGAIYEWDMINNRRSGEIVNKGIIYHQCALTSDGKYIYAIGSDNYVKEIRASNVTRMINFEAEDANHIVMSKTDNFMFISYGTGNILSVKMPITDPPDYTEYRIHSSQLTQLAMTGDEKYLITCSQKGTICIWNISVSDSKRPSVEMDFSYFDEILISKSDLDEKLCTMKDLTQRTYELEMEHTYQTRHTETVYKEKINDIHDTYSQAIEELKETLEALEASHNSELNNISSDINVIKERHEAEMLELEAKYNSDLIVEYNKIENLEALTKSLTEEYKRKLQALKASKEKTIEELRRINESKLYNLNKMVEEAEEDINKEVTDHQEFVRQIEDDNDEEIDTLKNSYEKIIKAARESNIRLKGESGVLKKKILSSQKEIEMIQMEIINIKADQEKLKLNIKELEKESVELKKEISDRDLRIQDKEKRIYDLKRKDQEYERYKFVLNSRIKELKNQIEPRDKEIKEKKVQIAAMEVELEDLQKININLDVNLGSMREKLNNVYQTLHFYKKKCAASTKLIEKVRTDIFLASGFVQDYKKLKEGIKKLYFKYNTDKDFAKARKGDQDCIAELQRQILYLEGITDHLNNEVKTSKQINYGEGMIYMEMNWSLMDEIYKILKKLKTAQSKIQDVETLLFVRMRKVYSPRQAHKLLQKALKTEEEVNEECQIKMEEASTKAALMAEELDSLIFKLEGLENALNKTAPSQKKKAKETLKFDIPSAF